MIKGAFGYLKEAEKVLLILRKNEPYADTWSLPGGAIEQGEKLEETVRRELKEETGLLVEVDDYIGEEHFDFGNKSFLAYVFYVTKINGELRHGEDVKAVTWFSKDDRKDLKIAPPIDSFFHRYNL